MNCFSKVCFMCLKYTDNENCTVLQHVGNKIVQQVKFVLPEIANLEPRLPLLICSTCHQALDDFHNFKNICIENSSRYNHYISRLQGPHGSSKGTLGDLQVKRNDYKLLITVKEEEENINSNIETDENMLDQDIKEMLDFTEELSTFKGNTDSIYQPIIKNETESNHRQDCDRNINYVDQTTEENIHFNEYKLRELEAKENVLEDEADIKEMIDSNEELSISEENKHSLPQKILKNETLINLVKDSDRKITEDKNHSSEQEVTNYFCKATDLKCLVCNAVFIEKSHLQNHMMAHYNVKQRKCSICEKIFKYVSTLRRHMNTHTDVKNYKCSICNDLFAEKQVFQRHMAKHTGVKDYKCSICNKLFVQNSNLKQHMAVHTGVKNYKCSICDKLFNVSSNLKKHTLIHSGVKDYKCTICNSTFVQNSSLKQHMTVHTGVKDYKCAICQKMFRLSSNLKQHMQLHTGVTDYKCLICNKLFVRKDRFKHHMTRHAGVKKF